MTPGDGAGSYCPSADPHDPDASVLGVVGGTAEQPRIVYLAEPVRVTPELLAKLGDAPVTGALRVTAPCKERACSHFRDSQCSLITKIVRATPEALPDAPVPRCHLRSRCRWWQQENVRACRRCPVVLTDDFYADELQWWITDPANSAEDFDPRDFAASVAGGRSDGG